MSTIPAGMPMFNGGQLPFQPKTITHPTPDELAILKSIDPNWKPGDPVHEDLATALRQVEQEVAAADAAYMPVHPGTPPLAVPTPLNIATLSPERQQEIMTTLAQMQKLAQTLPPAPVVPLPDASPEINNAILEARAIAERQAQVRAAMAAASAPTDIKPMQVATAQAPPTPAPTPVPPPVTPAPTPVPPPVTPAPEPAQAPIADNTNALAPPLCPHCGWDKSQLSLAEPSVNDKRVFLAALLGGKRFYKDVELFNGNIVVRFHSRSTAEVDWAMEQIQYDVRNGMDISHVPVQIVQYELCCTVESITSYINGTPVGTKMPETFDRGGDVTVLPGMLKHLNSVLFVNEPLRRAVNRAFLDFRDLVHKLEANAENQDFYNGIVPAF